MMNSSPLIPQQADIRPLYLVPAQTVFSNYDVMAEGKDPLGPIYAQMIDSVLADQTIDHDGLVQVCDDAVKAESEGNWLKFESTDPNYLEVQYAASFEMSLKELDGWLMEHLVKKLLTRP